MFGVLCRGALRFCEECPPASAEGRILLVCSQRGLTPSPHGTAPLLRAHRKPAPRGAPAEVPRRDYEHERDRFWNDHEHGRRLHDLLDLLVRAFEREAGSMCVGMGHQPGPVGRRG
jgi:hypothetical protein